MTPAISQICSLNSPFEMDVADYAAGACHAMEVWLGKLDQYLAQHSLEDVRRLLAEHEMQVPVASFQGGLLTSQGDARREHWATFARRLEQCRVLEIRTLVLAADVLGPISQADIDRVGVSLQQAAEQAARVNVRLALEFQSQATFGNNLQTAAALVAEANQPNLGLCLDVFHYYKGPSKEEDLAYLSSENLFHVQLCDLAGVPREFATDSDRVLPGDGDFQLERLLGYLQQINYDGCVSIEVMNPVIWNVPSLQMGEIGMTALRKLLGQSSMG